MRQGGRPATSRSPVPGRADPASDPEMQHVLRHRRLVSSSIRKRRQGWRRPRSFAAGRSPRRRYDDDDTRSTSLHAALRPHPGGDRRRCGLGRRPHCESRRLSAGAWTGAAEPDCARPAHRSRGLGHPDPPDGRRPSVRRRQALPHRQDVRSQPERLTAGTASAGEPGRREPPILPADRPAPSRSAPLPTGHPRQSERTAPAGQAHGAVVLRERLPHRAI